MCLSQNDQFLTHRAKLDSTRLHVRIWHLTYIYTTFSMYAKCAIRAHILSRIRLKSLSWNFLLIVLIRSKVVSLERRHIQKLVIEKYFLVSVYVPPHELTITNILFVTSIYKFTNFTNPQFFLSKYLFID